MNLLKQLKSFLVLAFVMGFLFSATLTSCGNKNTSGNATEQNEHPNDEEHPNEDGDEHPNDTTEHPDNE